MSSHLPYIVLCLTHPTLREACEMAEAVDPAAGLLDVPLDDKSAALVEEPVEEPEPTLSLDDLLSAPVNTLTIGQVSATLSNQPIADTPALCLRLLGGDTEDLALAKEILHLGLARAVGDYKGFEASLGIPGGGELHRGKVEAAWGNFGSEEQDRVRRYAELSAMERRVAAWEILQGGVMKQDLGEDASSEGKAAEGDEAMELDDPWAEAEAEDIEIDDPWNDAASDKASAKGSVVPVPTPLPAPRSQPDDELPIPLYVFLRQPLLQSAVDFAAAAYLSGLRVLLEQFADLVGPVRLSLAQACPDWVTPKELDEAGLLPRVDAGGKEVLPPTGHAENTAPLLAQLYEMLGVEPSSHPELPTAIATTVEELQDWYSAHILSLDMSGQVDLQLSWVQHAEECGVPGLDELGEDLSLLSRLVYESALSPEQHERWSLEAWRASTPSTIIGAFLSRSSPTSIVADLKSRVLPYLYVLESRAERSGSPDPNLIERYLCETILSLPLSISLPIFEASKATLGKSDRIIKDDLNVARLALACLYGSDQRDVWGVMSSIFECLPVWELSGRDPQDDAELTSTTLESIAAFIRPTASQPVPPKAADLMMFFQPLPFASLSRALDILDVHLESGEILARWDVPVQLRFLLQSSRDAKEQVELAERMVRKAAVSGVKAGLRGPEKTRLGGASGGEEAKWARLWDDMLRLNGSGDQLLRGAFGMVDGGELMRVYLGGLLRSGSEFTLTEEAKSMADWQNWIWRERRSDGSSRNIA